MPKKAKKLQARMETGMQKAQFFRGTRERVDGDYASPKYSAGWLVMHEPPEEDLIYLNGHTWVQHYVGAETRRIYKYIKRTKEWARFQFAMMGD